MGLESKRILPLPAPTETDSVAPSEPATELASELTDVTASQPGDEKSHYSLPDDGTPVTIKTRGHQHNKSQTSLLIEYFETSKPGTSTDRKPSVRVRVTPSSKSRQNDHHIQITETRSSQVEIEPAAQPNRRRPRRPASPLIPNTAEGSRVSYMQSEISAIPTDSFLDAYSPYTADSQLDGILALGNMPPQKPSGSRDRPSASKSRGERAERSEREKKHKSSGSKSRSSSVNISERHADAPKRSSRHQESVVSSIPDSSILSSQMSASQHSKISGTSKASGSSINNPKLLETVEDAIRRLILPELNALKREQSKRGGRPAESLTASSVTSRDSRDDRSEKRRSTKSTESRDSARYHEPRNREARNELEETIHRDGDDDSIVEHYDTPRKSHDKLKAAAAGGALGAASAMVASALDQSPSDVSKRRRRRSEKKLSSQSTEDVYGHDEGLLQPPMPPMPLSSEINASELTRTSILSADTDRPHSATEELTPIQEVPRGMGAVGNTPAPTKTPVTLEHLGANHANISHGDLKNLPQRRTGEFPKGIEGPVHMEEEYDEEEEPYEQDMEDYPGQYDQDVPAPLNYVPYQPASRGLSPIQSVSGYTDGHSEVEQHRDSRITQASDVQSPGRPLSNVSAPSNMRSHDFDASDVGSLRSSGVEAYRNAPYAEDSELDNGQTVQAVGANPKFVSNPMGIESNVASLVDGSVIEPSVLSSAYHHQQQQQYGLRDSVVSPVESFEEPRSATEARGISPGSASVASRRQLFEERMDSPSSRRSNLSREFQEEYEPDQYGRKVPMAATQSRQQVESPTPSETAITGAAVLAAAAGLKAAQGKQYDEDVPAGVARNKSFKERAKVREPAATPKHSVDRFSFEGSPTMEATGGPGFGREHLPEIGYGIGQHSVVDEPVDTTMHQDWDDHRSANATPTPSHMQEAASKGMSLPDVVTPAPLALGNASHSRQPSQDPSEDFHRTSVDRKRETILTNPYENASPIAGLTDANQMLLDDAMANQHYAPYTGTPNLQQKMDEGYISQGPNRTPDYQDKGKAVDYNELGQYPDNAQHLSGMSQGMASPFYDASTGTGIDRIENKDIYALMQHLMVRDAQRSARDTEILVTLVRTAADMRNSFDAVTKLLGDVENTVITEVQDNTDKTVRTHLGGPRPYPASVAGKSIANGSQAGTDEVAKKRSFLKKALNGLTLKGSNDLGRIEDMLMHLLTEVDVLKTQTAAPARSAAHQQSFDNLQPEVASEHDKGYEPEGMAGTSMTSHGSQSGQLSLPQRGVSAKTGYDNRISTVHEGDEDGYEVEKPDTPRQEHYNNPDMLMSPRHESRGGSLPPGTPPLPATAPAGSMSQDNTPKDKGKKHKSGGGSSNWFPKISRWSETTASSVGNKFRMSGSSKKNQSGDFVVHQPPSRSGSDLGAYDAEGFLRTDPYGEDKVQMQTGYDESDLGDILQPPPPTTYMTPEDPKYKAHRNSLNLQHPQPRQGNTERFKMALETSAQDYDTIPTSPRSGNWAGSVSSLNRVVEESGRYADGSQAAQATQEYWGPTSSTATGPPRPPKEPMGSPSTQTPPRSNKLTKAQPYHSPAPYHSVESGYGTATTGAEYVSPKLENKNLSGVMGGVPTRRPSGPRAMTPKNGGGGESPDERRRKRDTFGTLGSQESETF